MNLAGGIVRQDDLKAIHSRIDWEHMYRTADYHKIANVVYLGILGNGEKVPERWMGTVFWAVDHGVAVIRRYIGGC